MVVDGWQMRMTNAKVPKPLLCVAKGAVKWLLSTRPTGEIVTQNPFYCRSRRCGKSDKSSAFSTTTRLLKNIEYASSGTVFQLRRKTTKQLILVFFFRWAVLIKFNKCSESFIIKNIKGWGIRWIPPQINGDSQDGNKTFRIFKSDCKFLHDNDSTSNLIAPEGDKLDVQTESRKTVSPSVSKKKNVFAGKSARFWLCFAMLNLTAFVSSLDAVVVAGVLPTITADLGGNSNQAFWSGSGFLLAATITQPLFGTFSELFGRKIMLLSALFWFFVGSILCTLSPNMNLFIASRVVYLSKNFTRITFLGSRDWRRWDNSIGRSHSHWYPCLEWTWCFWRNSRLGLGTRHSCWTTLRRSHNRTYNLEMVNLFPLH